MSIDTAGVRTGYAHLPVVLCRLRQSQYHQCPGRFEIQNLDPELLFHV